MTQSSQPAGLVLVTTGGLLPAGLLSVQAWDVLRSLPVCCGLADHPQRAALEAAGIDVSVLGGLDSKLTVAGETPIPDVDDLLSRAPLVWLADPGRHGAIPADAELVAALRRRPEVREVVGSVDPPGAALLDAVAVMDRLRSPGGCPWDAQQTFDSLRPYLLEEAYEAYEALEEGDLDALRDELGDVLLQVLFHARIASEGAGGLADAGGPWDIDDVAAGLVAKLVRRHPHVFGDREVSGAAEVQTNWDEIKAAERSAKAAPGQGPSPTDGVPMALPALSLAAKLQSRAAKAGFPIEQVTPSLAATESPAGAVASVAAELLDGDVPPSVSRVGDLLFAAVALARAADVDAEAALRGAARRFREHVDELAAEVRDVHDSARIPHTDPAHRLAGDPDGG